MQGRGSTRIRDCWRTRDSACKTKSASSVTRFQPAHLRWQGASPLCSPHFGGAVSALAARPPTRKVGGMRPFFVQCVFVFVFQHQHFIACTSILRRAFQRSGSKRSAVVVRIALDVQMRMIRQASLCACFTNAVDSTAARDAHVQDGRWVAAAAAVASARRTAPQTEPAHWQRMEHAVGVAQARRPSRQHQARLWLREKRRTAGEARTAARVAVECSMHSESVRCCRVPAAGPAGKDYRAAPAAPVVAVAVVADASACRAHPAARSHACP